MVTPSQVPKHHLNPINTHWHNRSLSSLSATSDAATFHSAHAHLSNMELRQLSLTQHHSSVLTSLPLSTNTQPLPSPKLTAIKMDRQDSGYADSQSHSTPQSPTSTSHSRRTSTSSSVKRRNSPSTNQRSNTTSTSRPKRKTTNSSSSSSTTRHHPKRATTQLRTSNPGSRPSLSSRHTTPFSHHLAIQQQQPYQFFQFPSLTDSSPPNTTSNPNPNPNSLNSNSSPNPTTVSSPPPATIQYWTSDSTRRLEYAAIDAASKGVRGFFIKLLPDCILPPSSRRTKFHCEDDNGSDAGSVRRYRLVLPEEKERECCAGGEGTGSRVERGSGSGKKGLLRRWMSFGGRGGRRMD